MSDSFCLLVGTKSNSSTPFLCSPTALSLSLSLSADGDGSISIEEFMNCAKAAKKATGSKESIVTMTEQFLKSTDSDDNSSVSAAEFELFFSGILPKLAVDLSDAKAFAAFKLKMGVAFGMDAADLV
jgi:hypothetical protein